MRLASVGVFLSLSSIVLSGCVPTVPPQLSSLQPPVDSNQPSPSPTPSPTTVAGVVLGTTATTAPTPQSEPLESAVNTTTKVYNLINAHRRDTQLSVLKIDRRLEASAQAKLADMRASSAWDHQDSAGQNSWHFFREHGYHYTLAGENLALDYETPWKIFEGWTTSPPHNAEMLKPEYQAMGVAHSCVGAPGAQGACMTVLHLGRE